MPKPRHRVHDADEDVLQGVWTQKSTNRGVHIAHTGIPGVQGPPSPSKRASSPVKPAPDRRDMADHESEGDLYDYDMFNETETFTRGKVRTL